MKNAAMLFLLLLGAAFALFPLPAFAQSQQDAIRIHKEAYGLQEQAKSNEDLKRALEKYEEAIRIYQRINDQKNASLAYNSAGLIYAHWGQYPKAVEFYEKSAEIARKLGDQKTEANALNNLGLVYSDWGQYPKAVEYYEKSLAIKRKLGDLKGEGQTLNNLGLVYSDWGQYPKAVEFYAKSLALSRKVGDVKTEGQTLTCLGNVYKHWGQYPKAVEFYEKSLALSRKVGDVKTEGQTLNNLGNVYADWGQYPKAVEFYEKSLAIFRKLGDLKGEGSSLNNLGLVYSDWGQYPKAVEYYEKSLAICRKLGDPKGEGQTIGNLGIVYKNWGQYPKAVKYYEKSLAICRKLGDPKGEGISLTCLGNVYKDWGQYPKAVEFYEKSLAIFRKLGDLKGEGSSLNNLGNVYSDWGQYPKAVEFYEKSAEIARKLGDQKTEANALGNLGVVYKDWGQYPKAVEFYEKSLAIKRKLGDLKGEATTLNNFGNVLQLRAEYDKALAHFEQGLAIYKKIGVPEKLAIENIANLYLDKGQLDKAEPFVKQSNVAVVLGRLSLGKSDWASAKRYYENELKRAETSRHADSLFTSCTGLGLAYEGMGDNATAAESFRKAAELVETLRSSLNEAEREKFFDVRIQGFYRTAPYEGLARVLAKMNKPQEALKQSEYTKARLFAEAISKKSGYTGSDVPKDMREKDSALTNELASLSKNLQKAYEKQNKDAIASLEPQVKQAKDKLAAHVAMLRQQYPLFAATKYPQPMDLSQAALRADEWVLSYDVGDPGLIVYLTKGKDLKKTLYKPFPRKDLDALVRKFIEPVDLKPGEDITAKISRFDFGTGKKLADILLSDILPELPKDTPLIIVPADCLGVLPFEMLLLGDGGKIVDVNGKPNVTGANFFGDRNPISYYQSVTALTLARNFGKQKGSGNKLLVMCDPVFSDKDPRAKAAASKQKVALLDRLTSDVLMSAQTENKVIWERMHLTSKIGETLKQVYPGLTDVYEGMNATKATFKKQDLTKYQAIVFGTHGYAGMDLGGLLEPVLVLTLINQPEGQDGFLRQSEVMGLKMNSDVVALTACQSGLGKRISGEGTMGMGRAFQYAGAKSVLMTLWSVAQNSSVQLTNSFFRHLKAGRPKLEALKLARDEIRKSGYDHPFFWAPFILVGETQ